MGVGNFLLILTLLVSHQARAEILFIDLNGAPEEVAAAERAAKVRGEKLIVWPQRTAETKKAVALAEAELNKSNTEYTKKCSTDEAAKGVQCANLAQERAKKYTSLRQARGQTKINYDIAKEKLAELSKNKVDVSSLIISGHDGTGMFTGAYGQLGAEQLGALGEEFPEVFKNTRGLMLWGCYTGTPGSILGRWKKSFPNAELIAGYDGRAPLANSPSSSVYLEDVLVKEKELTKIKDKNELEKAFKKIKDVNNVHSALCAGDIFVNKMGAADVNALKGMCENLPIAKWNERLTCYKAGQPGCENVPKDTAAGELRQIYNEVHAVDHCRELAPEKSVGLPEPGGVLRLLFYENVKSNFLANHKEEIPGLDDALKKLGAPADLLMGDVGKLSRADLMKKMDGISQFLGERGKSVDTLHDPMLAEQLEAKSRLDNVSRLLGDLNTYCVGFDWVEPGAASQSGCVMKSFSYAVNAEVVRANTVTSIIQKKAMDIVQSDPEYQEIKKLPTTAPDTPMKIRQYTERAMEKFAPEINKVVQEQKADLSNQPSAPKGIEDSYNRESVIKYFEDPHNLSTKLTMQIIQSSSGWANGSGTGMGGGMMVNPAPTRPKTTTGRPTGPQ